MNLYSNKQRWKIVLFIIALVIAGGFLYLNSYFTSKLRTEKERDLEKWSQTIRKKADLVKLTNQTFEEKKKDEQWKAELWVRATEELQKDLNDYSLSTDIRESVSIPLIMVDESNNYSGSFNLNVSDTSAGFQDSVNKYIVEWPKINPPLELDISGFKLKILYDYSDTYYQLSRKRDSLINSFNDDLSSNTGLVPFVFVNAKSNELLATNISDLDNLELKIESFKAENEPISINLGGNNSGLIYHDKDPLLTQIKYFPYIQIGIISLFILIGYLLFSTFRKAEQNQVWAGMAKETAHQLGTPLSSLMAWIEMMKAQGVDENMVNEMNKDVDRLHTITERFSKIGSETKLEVQNVSDVIIHSANYLQSRVSKNVEFVLPKPGDINAKMNQPLFEWVMENLTKNAVDAMEGKGKIIYSITQNESEVFIDIKDSGKGIPSGKLKTVFEPGYSTKQRGWGLGLSLAKRIIENYHNGKIFVLESAENMGTTFRIILNQ